MTESKCFFNYLDFQLSQKHLLWKDVIIEHTKFIIPVQMLINRLNGKHERRKNWKKTIFIQIQYSFHFAKFFHIKWILVALWSSFWFFLENVNNFHLCWDLSFLSEVIYYLFIFFSRQYEKRIFFFYACSQKEKISLFCLTLMEINQ